MKHLSKQKFEIVIRILFSNPIAIILVCWLSSCDKVDGPVAEGGEIPKVTAALIKESFPDASNAVFRTVADAQLWEARFESGGISYYAGLSSDKIVAIHRLVGNAVPDSIERIIRDKIPIAKLSTLTDYREELLSVANPEKQYYRAKMTADGTEYLIKWNFNRMQLAGKVQIAFGLHEQSIFDFETDLRNNPLPATLKAFQDRTDYIVVKLKTRVLGKNKIHYHFTPENEGSPMVLDGNGLLIGSYKFTEAYKSFDEFPYFIRARLTYFGTQHDQTSVFSGKFSEDNNTGYRILTWGDSVTADFFFDANGGIPSFNYGVIVEI